MIEILNRIKDQCPQDACELNLADTLRWIVEYQDFLDELMDEEPIEPDVFYIPELEDDVADCLTNLETCRISLLLKELFQNTITRVKEANSPQEAVARFNESAIFLGVLLNVVKDASVFEYMCSGIKTLEDLQAWKNHMIKGAMFNTEML